MHGVCNKLSYGIPVANHLPGETGSLTVSAIGKQKSLVVSSVWIAIYHLLDNSLSPRGEKSSI